MSNQLEANINPVEANSNQLEPYSILDEINNARAQGLELVKKQEEEKNNIIQSKFNAIKDYILKYLTINPNAKTFAITLNEETKNLDLSNYEVIKKFEDSNIKIIRNKPFGFWNEVYYDVILP